MVIAPSLFAADAGRLAQETADVEKAGARYLHIDIMDGHYVPNLSFGPHVVAGLRSASNMVFDIHLMIGQPLRFCRTFIEAGADMLAAGTAVFGKADRKGAIDSLLTVIDLTKTEEMV